jgi:hypothetical protein
MENDFSESFTLSETLTFIHVSYEKTKENNLLSDPPFFFLKEVIPHIVRNLPAIKKHQKTLKTVLRVFP